MRHLFSLLLLTLSVTFFSCNKCKDVNCNSGTCDAGVCSCPSGFSGTSCEIEDKCITHAVSCENDGECVDGTCDCAANYYGESCADFCDNGTYTDGVCVCDPGYEGDGCDVESRIKFYGDYDFTSGCNAMPATSKITAWDDEEYPERVSITNITSHNDTKGYAEISYDTLWIPKQKLVGFTVESTGPAFKVNNVIEIPVSVKDNASGGVVNCTHILTLQ